MFDKWKKNEQENSVDEIVPGRNELTLEQAKPIYAHIGSGRRCIGRVFRHIKRGWVFIRGYIKGRTEIRGGITQRAL